MNIWLINHYGVPLKYWPGNRTPQFAKYLLKTGHHVRVIAASTMHNSDTNLITDDESFREEIVDGILYTFIKCHQYSGNNIKRIFNMLEFPFKLNGVYEQFDGKPGVVLGSSLTPFACVEAIRIARHYKVKSVVEIRDLWPETAVAYGIIKDNNPVLIPMRMFEKKLYQAADEVIFTMKGGYDYIKERGWTKTIPQEKVHYINNGVDLELFDYNKEHYRIDDADLHDDSIFKVIYTGSIRFVNDLGKLLDVAKKIKNSKIKFLIWGKGDDLPALEQRVVDENIRNVVFKGYIDKKYIPYITSCADLNLMHGKNSPILRFGMSPNKMFDYMAAGKPILTDFSGRYNPTVQCGAGIDIENPTVENIVKAIDDFANMDAETYGNYCRNARKGAEQYDFKNLTKKLLEIMEK